MWQELGDAVVGDQNSLFLDVSVLVEDLLLIVFLSNDLREVVFIPDHKLVGASHNVCERRFLGRCVGWGTCQRDSAKRDDSKWTV